MTASTLDLPKPPRQGERQLDRTPFHLLPRTLGALAFVEISVTAPRGRVWLGFRVERFAA